MFLFLKCSPRPVKRSFDNPVEIYSGKNRIFFARSLKTAKTDFQRKPPLKLFQWTVRMHFWQIWRYFSARKQMFLSESPKVINNSTTFLQKMFNAKNASGEEECSCDKPVDKHSTKSRRFFAQCPKKMGGKLKGDISSQNNPIARWNAVLTTQSKNFRTKVKNFRSMSEQENVRFSSESFSAQLVPMCNWKAVSTTLSKSLSQNADDFLPNIWKI